MTTPPSATCALGLLLLATALVLSRDASGSGPESPPAAKKVPHTLSLHGESWDDPYFWLREKSNPDVKAYLEAENAWAESFMRPTAPLQEQLYREMLGRVKEDDATVPYLRDGYLYSTRTEKGKAYPVHLRRKGEDGPEEVVIDLNEMAKGHRFLGLGVHEVSDDGRLLAFSTDVTGFRDYTLQVKDLKTGVLLARNAERVTSAAWSLDGSVLYWVTTDSAKRPCRLWRGAPGLAGEPELVHEEKDERFTIGVARARDRRWIVLQVSSHTTSEAWLLPAAEPKAAPRRLFAREPDHEYHVEPAGDLLYVRTNKGCRNGRVVAVPATATSLEGAQEVLGCRENVMVTGLDAFAGHLVVTEREDGVQQIRVLDRATGEQHRITFADPIRATYPVDNHEWNATRLRYSYESLVSPPAVFDHDMVRRTETLLKRTEVLGGYDPSLYASERLLAPAPDGTRIPVSIVYRKDLVRDGSRPALLMGYGSYGYPSATTFNSSRVSLLDRGVVYAIAHVRGGGELGKRWHDAGRMMSKWNTFTDFVAAAEMLVETKVTASDRLAIEGGSAGGLLMGAVTNLRPDLFRAVVSRVPFVDVISTMLDESLPLTVGEFEEWGNPRKRAEFLYLRTYSPYENLRKGAYPAILVKTSLDDSQVMYWEPAKYVARLRTLKTDSRPLLFKTNLAGGHGGSSGRYDRLREFAFDTAFVLGQIAPSRTP